MTRPQWRDATNEDEYKDLLTRMQEVLGERASARAA